MVNDNDLKELNEWNYEKDGLKIDSYGTDEYETIEDSYKGTMTLIRDKTATTFEIDFDKGLTLWAYVDWLQDMVNDYKELLQSQQQL